MTEVEFKDRRLNTGKLLSFGFEVAKNSYIFYRDLADGQMKLTVTVTENGKIYTEVTDHSNGDEYVLHRIANVTGAFVGQIRSEYEAILEEIFTKCFDTEIFKTEQAKAVIAHIRETYGNELEYLWKKFPDNAVVRRTDNQKWYAALLSVSRRKLGFASDETVEILDLRMTFDDIGKMVDGVKFLPGYHMNKNHWITICLDGTVEIDEIFQKIAESYQLAKK